MRMKFTFKSILLACALLVGSVNAWADDWNTIWYTDFSSEPTGMTYSIAEGTVAIEDGILTYKHDGSGGRSVDATFTDSKFAVTETNWVMEFDWGSSGPNAARDCNVTFSTNKGDAFKIIWGNYDAPAKITDSNDTELTTTLPSNNIVSRVTDLSLSHFIITGDKDNGIYLTVTNGGNTYVDNVLVSSDFGYPTKLAGSLAQSYSGMYIDNIYFKTPAVVGFVASPAIEVTAPVGIARKFTLSCLTENATIFYSETDIEIETEGWTEYKSESVTSAETIYAYAKDAEGNTSEKVSFQTGAGSVISLNAPTFSATSYSNKQYTIAISSNQSDVELKPTATIFYRIGEDGDFETYSNPITVDENETVYAYANCDGFGSSSEVSYATVARPILSSVWNLDFAGQATAEKGEVTIESDELFTAVGTSFYGITAENFTSNEKFGVANNNTLLLRTAGNKGLYLFNNGDRAIGISNLEEGQYVIVKSKGQAYNIVNVAGAAEYVQGASTSDEMVLKATTDGNVSITIKKETYIQSIEVLDTKVAVTISKAGYSTFSSEYAVEIPEGLTAYIATATNVGDDHKGTITLEEVSGTVAANTGLLLKGDAEQEYKLPVSAEGGESYDGDNLLKPTAADGQVEAGNYIFAFETNDPSKYGFYYLESATGVGAGKAYLATGGASEIKTFSFVFGGGTATAIETVETADADAEGAIYNVAGQQVGKDYKGIVIKNGKKYLNK